MTDEANVNEAPGAVDAAVVVPVVADDSAKPVAPHVALGRAVAVVKRAEKKLESLSVKEGVLKAKLAVVHEEQAVQQAAHDAAVAAKAAALKVLE